MPCRVDLRSRSASLDAAQETVTAGAAHRHRSVLKRRSCRHRGGDRADERVAHTIKGSANITGVAGIANLTHYMEDILEFFASHERLPPPGLGDALLDASDCLEVMVEHLLGMEPPHEYRMSPPPGE